MPEPCDVIYLAWNRLEYTLVTFPLLLQNTDWSLVRKLIVFEDGSTDGTREYLDEMIGRVHQYDGGLGLTRPVDASLSFLGYRSPVRTMMHYLSGDSAARFAKIDSDIACPPGWLNALSVVMDKHSELELLGMQPGMGGPSDPLPYYYMPASHIGGVGLMRSNAFLKREPMAPAGRFGFTRWQERNQPVRGWLSPDIPCPQLDLLPHGRWPALAERYVAAGWQREWPKYEPDSTWMWDWTEALA